MRTETESYVHRIIKDSSAIKEAAQDEEKSMSKIVENFRQDLAGVSNAINTHDIWFGITEHNAKTIFSSLIAKVNKAIRTGNALNKLKKSESDNFRKMAGLGDKLAERLESFRDALSGGLINSKVQALQQFKLQVGEFIAEIGGLVGEQYRVDEFIKKVA